MPPPSPLEVVAGTVRDLQGLAQTVAEIAAVADIVLALILLPLPPPPPIFKL